MHQYTPPSGGMPVFLEGTTPSPPHPELLHSYSPPRTISPGRSPVLNYSPPRVVMGINRSPGSPGFSPLTGSPMMGPAPPPLAFGGPDYPMSPHIFSVGELTPSFSLEGSSAMSPPMSPVLRGYSGGIMPPSLSGEDEYGLAGLVPPRAAYAQVPTPVPRVSAQSTPTAAASLTPSSSHPVPIVVDHFERSELGHRETQEDAVAMKGVSEGLMLFGVFDGHVGRRAADHCANHCLENVARHLPVNPSQKDCKEALRNGLYDTETQWLQLANNAYPQMDDGTTALVCCVTDEWVHVAHLGDSRAIIVNEGNPSVTVITQDHKANLPTEANRVRRLGGTVETNPGDCPRIHPGGFAFSRSIGDRSGKYPNCPLLSSVPDVNSFKIMPQMKWLVMACDGVWDVVTPQHCADVAVRCHSARDACNAIVDLSLALGTLDNVSALVVRLNDPQAGNPAARRRSMTFESSPPATTSSSSGHSPHQYSPSGYGDRPIHSF